MSTVFLETRSLKEVLADAARGMKTRRAEREARISFATPEQLWDVLSAKRGELLKAFYGAGPVSIREAALESSAHLTRKNKLARTIAIKHTGVGWHGKL